MYKNQNGISSQDYKKTKHTFNMNQEKKTNAILPYLFS